jgi:hypothetical protein
MEELVQRMRDAEDDFTREIRDRQRRWHYRLHRGRVWFDEEVRHVHQQLRQSLPAYLRTAQAASVLTAPVIYSILVPLVLLDMWVWLYQRVCFPLYGIAPVRRRAYIVVDRHHLAYLNGIEKVNCAYCSYANGLLAYVREVAARTEQYWCPIKHARWLRAPHARYHLFFDYGDANAYRQHLADMRSALGHDHARVAFRDH